jgi:hypothetical protein
VKTAVHGQTKRSVTTHPITIAQMVTTHASRWRFLESVMPIR